MLSGVGGGSSELFTEGGPTFYECRLGLSCPRISSDINHSRVLNPIFLAPKTVLHLEEFWDIYKLISSL